MENISLKREIIAANESYRKGSPVVSDAEYDDMLEQYGKTVPADEFERFVSSLHEKTGKARLPYIMGSLTKLKCSEPDTIVKFISDYVKTKLNVSAKVDGISACLTYRNGRLTHAMTRGDGYNGEWLDDKIRFVKGVPETLSEAVDIDIRGELVILKDDFKTMSGSNPRNVCAGIMNRKVDSKEWNETDARKITFVPYTVLGEAYRKDEQFSILERLGFSTAWHKTFDVGFFERNGLNVVDELFKYATQDLPYEIDGCVISSSEYRNENKYRPDAQMAVKTNTMSAVTRLIDVAWEGPSANGVFVPVAVLEPVELGGAVITRATCHNVDFIREKNLKYGSAVEIVKSGDIIPKIIGVVGDSNGCSAIELPKTCLCCGGELHIDGVNLTCSNPECRDQVIYQIEHFIKKLGVMSVSFKTLDNLGIDSYEKLISFVPDKKYKTEVKFANELTDKVFSKKDTDIFCALNMRDLGETLQRKIIEYYGWDAVKSRNCGFSGMPAGIGDITLRKFISAYIRNLDITEMFTRDPRYSYVETSTDTVSTGNSRHDKSICFTGALSISRGEATRLAEKAGFDVKSAVTKDLTYLVTPDPNSGSSKNKKAAQYGTKIIDEKEFMRLVDDVDTSISDL